MIKKNPVIVIFDGHDGTGKTTLAKNLAGTLNGIYVRPFEGNSGVQLINAADAKLYQKVLLIGKEAINTQMASVVSAPLIFDRHWLTVLSLLPEMYQKCWPIEQHMFSFLCTASLNTIKSRLNAREEEKFDDTYHRYYLNKYEKIAENCNVSMINTENNTVQCLLEKIKTQIDSKIQ